LKKMPASKDTGIFRYGTYPGRGARPARLLAVALDDSTADDLLVRLIDAYVARLHLKVLGARQWLESMG
jgi:hypothetical protein